MLSPHGSGCVQSFKKRKSEADDEMLWRQRVKEKASGKRPTDVDHLIASLTKPTKRSQSQAAPEGTLEGFEGGGGRVSGIKGVWGVRGDAPA